MSMYGPPGGGGYPGQPQDPWQGGSNDPYGQQPGGDPYGGQASSPFGGQPGGDPYGQPPQDPYGQPPPQDPYGQPPQDPYGQPPQDPYGQPSGPPAGDPWGAPAPPPMSGPPGPPMSGPPGQPMGGQPWAPPPPQKSNAGLIIVLSLVGVIVLCVGAVLVFALIGDDKTPSADPTGKPTASAEPSDTETSEAPTDEPTKYDLADVEEGDCLYDSDPSDTSAQLSFVSCDERGTDHYEVLKRIDDTQDAKKCEDVEGYDTSFTSSSGNFVLCVKELT